MPRFPQIEEYVQQSCSQSMLCRSCLNQVVYASSEHMPASLAAQPLMWSSGITPSFKIQRT